MSQRRALALLTIAIVLGMSTWFSASAVLPQLRARWALDATASAWITIAVQLGFVFGALFSAVTNLSDQLPPRAVILVSALGAAAANALVTVAAGPSEALVLRFATGLFAAGIYPPMLKLMATHFREGRGLALGVLVAGITLGSALPHLINGLGGLPWQDVVVATSALTVLGGCLALLVPTGRFPFPRGSFEPRYVARAFADPAVRLANFGYFGHMWELFAMWSWFAIFFGDSLAVCCGDAARSFAPLGAFAAIGAGGVGAVIAGVMSDRWGRTRTAASALAISGTCALVIGATYGGPPALVLAIGIVWGIAVVADSAQFSTMVSELADQAYVGTALTTQLAIGFALTAATIWLVPLVRDALGWPLTFVVLVPGPVFGVVAMLRLARRPEAARIAGGRG